MIKCALNIIFIVLLSRKIESCWWYLNLFRYSLSSSNNYVTYHERGFWLFIWRQKCIIVLTVFMNPFYNFIFMSFGIMSEFLHFCTRIKCKTGSDVCFVDLCTISVIFYPIHINEMRCEGLSIAGWYYFHKLWCSPKCILSNFHSRLCWKASYIMTSLSNGEGIWK